MKQTSIKKMALGCLVFASMAISAFAQAPAAGGGRPAPQPIPLFLRETWKGGAVAPITPAAVTNPDLELRTYGTEINVTDEGNVPHIWTGLCASSCAVTLRHRESNVDLSGKARVKWFLKTSGFHEVRPIVKLTDGTWLVGDHADAYTYDYHEVEFFLADVRWLKLDITKVQTKGTLLDKVDLSKVEEFGFADLTPGSGHGLGGFSDVGWIEVYGKPIKREAAAAPAAK